MAILEEWRTLREWVEQGHGLPIFERYDQIHWFVRKHRDELIACAAFLPARGSLPALVSPEFTEVVTRVLKQERLATAANDA